MIKVLHYIQTVDMGKDNTALQYVDILVRAMQNEAESYVVKQNEVGSNWLSFRSHFIKRLEEIQPDIVHIHGSWNYYTAFAEKLARKKDFFTILSPHGTLSPRIVDEPDFWKKKLPRMIRYQLGMVHKTKCIIATDEQEEEGLKKLGWKKRITTVCATSDDTQNYSQTHDQLLTAYNKVIDTYYSLRITEEEVSFVNRCMRAALWEYDQLPDDITLTDEDKKDIDKLSMRRISLYIFDNHITDLFFIGAERLGIKLSPSYNVEDMPRYKQRKQKKSRWDKNIEKICSVLSELIDGISISVDYTTKGQLSILTYGNIYSAMRFNDYDEDKFNSMIKKKFVRKTTARLMTKLQNDFGLEIGFMPILPK